MRLHTLRSLTAAVAALAALAVSGCASGTQTATPVPATAVPTGPAVTATATFATPAPRTSSRADQTPPERRSTHEPVVLRSFSPFTATTSPTAAPAASQGRRANLAPPGSVNCAVAKCVALTFDDGPGPHTSRLLGMLTSTGARATFFMQGVNVQASPAVARQVANTPGMEIGDHSATHPQLTGVGSDRLRREIVGNHATIKRVTGKDVTVFRPPYGARNASVDAMAAQAGESVILWDVDTMDWRTRSASSTRQSVANQTKPGSIVLMHDIHGSTVDAVPGIISDLQSKGYTLVTVSELLGGTTPGRVYTRR